MRLYHNVIVGKFGSINLAKLLYNYDNLLTKFLFGSDLCFHCTDDVIIFRFGDILTVCQTTKLKFPTTFPTIW